MVRVIVPDLAIRSYRPGDRRGPEPPSSAGPECAYRSIIPIANQDSTLTECLQWAESGRFAECSHADTTRSAGGGRPVAVAAGRPRPRSLAWHSCTQWELRPLLSAPGPAAEHSVSQQAHLRFP